MLTEQVIRDGSLRSDPNGFTFDLRLPWYRALTLSSVEGLEVRLNGESVASESLRLSLDGKTYALRDLPPLHDHWWYVADPAEVRVPRPGGLAPGEHELDVTIAVRIPYIVESGHPLVMRERCVKTQTTNGASPRATGLPWLGVTLYSFTPDFHAGRYTFDDLIVRAAELGLGPGLEVIGFQSFRDFPHVSSDTEKRFRRLVDEHGWELSCLDGNVDIAVRADRLLDEDELVEYMDAQLATAGRLGFPVLRIQNAATPVVVERLLPTAERLDVKLGMEIHAPETVESPWVLALRELYERLDSPYLGFIPDFGASTRGISPSVFETFRAKGVSEELLDAIAGRWDELGEREFEAHEEIGNLIRLAHSMGAGDHAVNLAVFAVGIHGHQDPQAWREILPHVVHVHGKFFDIGSDGREPVVPLEELLDVLVDGGYRGCVSSEYEGWHWNTQPDAFDMVARQQALCRGALARYETAVLEGERR
jgi:Domain of unknown function (DUF6379)/Xylose isomerase-like TIM barrel